MNEPAQGSIVLVDFTYSNQAQSKVRPALVVSNSRYNAISRDVIVMKITSRTKDDGSQPDEQGPFIRFP